LPFMHHIKKIANKMDHIDFPFFISPDVVRIFYASNNLYSYNLFLVNNLGVSSSFLPFFPTYER
jgi:hypothetical protein